MDAFTKSQIYKTDPNPYDQIVVISQKALNDALQNMYALAPDDSPLFKLSLDIYDNTIEADLGPPKISLQVTSLDPQLYYYLSITSGKMKLRKSTSSKDTSTKEFDIAGWEIAFPVKISRKVLKDGDSEYGTYADKVGFKNKAFSIAKLYIDASTSASYDKAKSSFGSFDLSKETTTIQTNFRTLMTTWMSEAAENQTNVLGFSILGESTETVNTAAPTFVPISIDYYNYPWCDPAKNQTAANKVDALDENALCYLTVSKPSTPPELVGLPYSGAFVNKDALLCMNAKVFWGSWLLPLLHDLNKGLELVPLKPYLELPKDDKWDSETGPNLCFGNNPDHPSSKDSYFGWTVLPGKPVTWSWNGGNLVSSKPLQNHGKNMKASESATSSTTVSFDAGGQKIKIEGTSKFKFYYEFVGTEAFSTFETTTKWHLNFALGAVNDGGLQITREEDPAGVACSTTTHTEDNKYIDWETDYAAFCSTLSNWIENYFSEHIGWLTNDLITALQHQNRLFLPASGVFLMKDGRFNERGDLLVSLYYNGAPPPATPTTAAPAAPATQDAPAKKLQLLKDLKAMSLYALPDRTIPEAFRYVPEEWKKLPRRRALVPAAEVRKDPPQLPLPTFTVKGTA